MKKRELCFGLLTGILGLAVAVGAGTVAKPCPHDEALVRWLTVEGALAAVLAGISMLKPNWITQAITALDGICILLTPGTLVRICASEQMRCRMITRPVAIVSGVLIAVLAVWWLALSEKEKKQK